MVSFFLSLFLDSRSLSLSLNFPLKRLEGFRKRRRVCHARRDELRCRLLHVVASDGSDYALRRVLEMLRKEELLEDAVILDDADGRTPLYHAALHGHASVISILASYGASLMARSALVPRLEVMTGSCDAKPATHELAFSRETCDDKTGRPTGDFVVAVPGARVKSGRWRLTGGAGSLSIYLYSRGSPPT